jgi:hypothetical protein
MADGMEATAFDQQYQPDDSNEGDDLLALFLNPEASQPNPPEQTEQHTVDDYSLFANDYDFAREALDAINRERNQVSVSANNERQTLTITPPDELTADKARFEQEIRRSRQDENAWPKLHYLWPQHPAIQWLQDKLLAQVARHSAPVLALPDADAVKQQLQPEESVFLVSGLIPNRKAHPVIWEWFAVRCHGGAVTEVLPARDWLQPLQLDSKLPNRAQPVSLTELEALRQPVINATRTEMQRRQQAFTEATQPTLDEKLAELAALKARQVTQLDLQLQGSQQAEHFKAAKREERLSRIDRVFNDYQTWVSDTLTIEPVPYIQIIAAFTRAHG